MYWVYAKRYKDDGNLDLILKCLESSMEDKMNLQIIVM